MDDSFPSMLLVLHNFTTLNFLPCIKFSSLLNVAMPLWHYCLLDHSYPFDKFHIELSWLDCCHAIWGYGGKCTVTKYYLSIILIHWLCFVFNKYIDNKVLEIMFPTYLQPTGPFFFISDCSNIYIEFNQMTLNDLFSSCFS